MGEMDIKSKDGSKCVWSMDWDSSFVLNSSHVFMETICPSDLPKLLCYENEVTFEFCLHSSSFRIEKCGVHLMFDEEVDGSSWVGEVEDVLSLANVHDNCEEVNEPQKIDGDNQLIKVSKQERLDRAENQTESGKS
ncbi:hypothetical protein QYF36_018283 [Acer negundo]|nr:hypothetical protein QYF36_018283 [Acer negundo]